MRAISGSRKRGSQRSVHLVGHALLRACAEVAASAIAFLHVLRGSDINNHHAGPPPPWQRLRSEVGIIDEVLHHPPSPPPRLHRLHRFRHHTLARRSPFEPVSNRCWLEIWSRGACSPLVDFPFFAHAPRPAHTPRHTPRSSKKPQWGLSNPLHVSINRHTSLTHTRIPPVRHHPRAAALGGPSRATLERGGYARDRPAHAETLVAQDLRVMLIKRLCRSRCLVAVRLLRRFCYQVPNSAV